MKLKHVILLDVFFSVLQLLLILKIVFKFENWFLVLHDLSAIFKYTNKKNLLKKMLVVVLMRHSMTVFIKLSIILKWNVSLHKNSWLHNQHKMFLKIKQTNITIFLKMVPHWDRNLISCSGICWLLLLYRLFFI